MPLLITESVYIPVLSSIQICLCFEVISLWLGEYIMALAFRFMIGGIIRATYYVRSHCNEKYVNELSQLLWVVLIQDTTVMMLTQGLYNRYTWFAVHLPSIVIIVSIHHRIRLYEWWRILREQQQSPV